MSKHGVLSLKPQRRLEWRGQDGQSETEQPDHSASLGDSITSSTRRRFSVHTTAFSASTRNFYLNGQTSTGTTKQNSTINPPTCGIPLIAQYRYGFRYT